MAAFSGFTDDVEREREDTAHMSRRGYAYAWCSFRAIARLVAATVMGSLVACGVLPAPPQASVPPLVGESLARCGEVFTPAEPPPGTDVDAMVERVRTWGAPPMAPANARTARIETIFGTVSRDGPQHPRHCTPLSDPGRGRRVWIVVWPDTPGSAPGTTSYTLVDARSFAFLIGDGPDGEWRGDGSTRNVA